MPVIRPSSDLRNNYNEISTIFNLLRNKESCFILSWLQKER